MLELTKSGLSREKSYKIVQSHAKKCLSENKNLFDLISKDKLIMSKISKSKISLSITGIAGPKGASLSKPIGLVYIGIKKGNKIKIAKYRFKKKGRNYIQKNAVKKSLALISSFLE